MLHSVGLIGALIAFLLVLFSAESAENRLWGLAWSSAVVVMNALVVVAYVVANFWNGKQSFRKIILVSFPIALFIMIISFGVYAQEKVGPLQKDVKTRERVVAVVESIRVYSEAENSLPGAITQFEADTDGIRYERKSSDTYRWCATVNRGSSDQNYQSLTIRDTYVYKNDFVARNDGEQCFTIEAEALYTYGSEYYNDRWNRNTIDTFREN